MCLGNLPNELSQDIFIRSGNFKVIPFLSKDFNRFFTNYKNSIFKQVFVNNNIDIELKLAFSTYTELMRINQSMDMLYTNLHKRMWKVSFEKYLKYGCDNIARLFVDIFKSLIIINHDLMLLIIRTKRNDIFELLYTIDILNDVSNNMWWFRTAIKYNNLDLVKRFIHKYNIDSTEHNYELLRDIAYKDEDNCGDIIEVLLTDPNVDLEIATCIINEARNDFSYPIRLNRIKTGLYCSKYVNFEQNKTITIDSLKKDREDAYKFINHINVDEITVIDKAIKRLLAKV